MAAEKNKRSAGAARSIDAARDTTNAAEKRDPAPATPGVANKLLTRSRLADTLFLAHQFASRFQKPQPHDPRRADAARDNMSYRKSAKRPAGKPRAVTKKA